MSSESSFNLSIFTDITKKICMCTGISILIIIIFILSPLSNFFKTSALMKLISIIIIIYIIYLNSLQINLLRNNSNRLIDEKIKTQLNSNIICSYIFTAFLALLIIFVIKSFF